MRLLHQRAGDRDPPEDTARVVRRAGLAAAGGVFEHDLCLEKSKYGWVESSEIDRGACDGGRERADETNGRELVA